jgi:ribosome-associated protein
LTTKKRSDGAPEAKKTAKRTTKAASDAARPKAAKPRMRSSHSDGGKAGTRRARPAGTALTPAPKARGAAPRKAALAGPKRAASTRTPRRSLPPPTPPEPSSASRALALALAAAGIEKKAIGIEILDVTGKVDYADYLVVMTGRSDRHVSSIATGIEEEMRKRKSAPLSMEGLTAATWVLIDFGDVVVHVFQEDARALYDIEGLWIDASRVPVSMGGDPPNPPARPVPDADKVEGGAARPVKTSS